MFLFRRSLTYICLLGLVAASLACRGRLRGPKAKVVEEAPPPPPVEHEVVAAPPARHREDEDLIILIQDSSSSSEEHGGRRESWAPAPARHHPRSLASLDHRPAYADDIQIMLVD